MRLGHEVDGQVEILAGLKVGEKVAAAGQFLLDAEANLKGLAPTALPALEMSR